jgi:hypothetical protein
MRLRNAIWLLLPLGWACGGRYEQIIEGDDQPDGGSTAAAGTTSSIGGSSSSKAGSSSRGGTTGKAGSSGRAGSSSKAGGSGRGGTSGVAGSTSIGGTTSSAGSIGTAGSGSICICAEPSCAPFFRAVPNADGCCDHCEVDRAECAMAQQGYLTYRDQILQKYGSLSCVSDSDCGQLFEKNECGVPLPCTVSLSNSQIMVVTQILDTYAQANCSSACPQRIPPPCPVVTPPRCLMSRCQ